MNKSILYSYFLIFLTLFGGLYIQIENGRIEISDTFVWIFIGIISYYFQSNSNKRKIYKFHLNLISKVNYIKILLVLISLAFIAAVFKHLSFKTHGFDVSFINQSLFFPYLNDQLFPANFSTSGSALGEHLCFSLLLVSPLTYLLKSDVLISGIQSLSVFIGLFTLLKSSKLNKASLKLTILCLTIVSFYALRSSLIWNFREDIFIFLGLCFFLSGIKKESFLLSMIGFFITILSKENAGIATFLTTIPVALDKTISSRFKKKILPITFFGSLVYLVLAFKFILPYFAKAKSTSPFQTRFGQWGSSPSEIVINLLITPKYWFELLQRVISFDSLKYIITLFSPLIICFKKDRVNKFVWIIPAIALTGLNMVSGLSSQISMSFHYELIILPFLFYFLTLIFEDSNFKIKNAVTVFVLALLFSGKWPGHYIQKYFPTIENLQAQYFISQLNAPVITDDLMSAQVNHLQTYYPINFNMNKMNQLIKMGVPALIENNKENQRIIKRLLDNKYSSNILSKKPHIIYLFKNSSPK